MVRQNCSSPRQHSSGVCVNFKMSSMCNDYPFSAQMIGPVDARTTRSTGQTSWASGAAVSVYWVISSLTTCLPASPMDDCVAVSAGSKLSARISCSPASWAMREMSRPSTSPRSRVTCLIALILKAVGYCPPFDLLLLFNTVFPPWIDCNRNYRVSRTGCSPKQVKGVNYTFMSPARNSPEQLLVDAKCLCKLCQSRVAAFISCQQQLLHSLWR
jgi:hypothetical protein